MVDPPTSNSPLSEVDCLSWAERQQLEQLFLRIYAGPGNFQDDLREKDWVLRLWDDSSRQLMGFSTLKRSLESFQGEAVVVYFSGDTLVLPEFRHRFDLPRLWAQAVFQLVEGEQLPCYWFLICSGFRTYRFLPIFYRDFYPRYDAVTPPDWQNFLDRLGQSRYGKLYHQGIAHLNTPCREPLPERRLDAHANFFLERNPGWSEGHELACLTRLSVDNQSPALRRLLRP